MTETGDSARGLERMPSPAVDRALTILEILVTADEPMTLTALARAAHMPLATCASIVQTLEIRGYAARRVLGRSHFWRPTLKLSALAAELVRKVDVTMLAQPYLRRLVDVTGMAAHLGMLENTSVIYVGKVGAPGMVQFNTYLGKTSPFNLTALGRAIAAYLPDEELTPLLDHLRAGSGPNARKVSGAEMREMLAEVRQQGYAIEDEEEDPGIGCVAAPYFDSQGRVSGSIGVTAFAHSFRGRKLKPVADAVRQQAAALTNALASGVEEGVV